MQHHGNDMQLRTRNTDLMRQLADKEVRGLIEGGERERGGGRVGGARGREREGTKGDQEMMTQT